MKKLKIISCVTDTCRFLWEGKILLHSLRENGYSDKTTLLIFQQRDFFMNDFSPEWKKLEEEYPEVEFVYYKDIANITRVCQIFNYISLFRLYVLQEYFKAHPELEKEAILYIDSDIIFTKPLDFTLFLQDDINYVSWTGNFERTDNYLWQPYFDKKIEQVVPERLEQYKKLDVLGKVAGICGTTREAITLNSPNIGGAQYLLKNINSQFWTDCFNASCEIKLYLEGINAIFMQGKTPQEKQNNGFQAFCSDMWAVLFTLIGRRAAIKTPKEMDFSWSCDRIARYSECVFCHNAGITSDEKIRIAFEKNEDGTNKFEDCKMFYKGAWDNKSPLEDLDYLYNLLNDPGNQQFCNNEYVRAMIKTVEK